MFVNFRKTLRIIILLSSITLITASKPHPPPKSVNVALETSFLFDPKELHQNRYFVTNIREFLDKLLVAIDPQQSRGRFRAQSKRRDTKQKLDERANSMEKIENKTKIGTSLKNVLDFVKNVGQTFVNLTGHKIAEAVNNIRVEVITNPTKPKYRGSTVIPEQNLRSFNNQFQPRQDKHGKKDIKEIISDSINNWMRRYPGEMRTIMDNTVNATNPLLNTFARRMNNYYSDDDIEKLKKLLKRFKRHIENNEDTSEIVNELLNNAVFKKYGSLNDTTKLALMEDLKMCTEILLSNDVFKGVNEHLSVLSRRSLPNHKIETGEIRNIDDMTYTNLRRSIDNKLRDTKEKNEDNKKKKSGTNEIVDSAEFVVRPARIP